MRKNPGTQKERFTLLKSGKEDDVYGLLVYDPNSTTPSAVKINNRITNFIKKGTNSKLFEHQIKMVSEFLGCKCIAPIPSLDGSPTSLQNIFGSDHIRKNWSRSKRKTNQGVPAPSQITIEDPGERVLIVHNITKPGSKIHQIKALFSDAVVLSIAIDCKLKPEPFHEFGSKKQDRDGKVIHMNNDGVAGNDEEQIQSTPGISIQDKSTFLMSLKTGMGLTRACEMILWHPKNMCSLLSKDPEFRMECEESVKKAARDLLILSNMHMGKLQMDRWHNNQQSLREFRIELVIWGEAGTLKDADNTTIIKAFMRYKDIADTSTALSCLKDELLNHIFDNKTLSVFFTEKKIL